MAVGAEIDSARGVRIGGDVDRGRRQRTLVREGLRVGLRDSPPVPRMYRTGASFQIGGTEMGVHALQEPTFGPKLLAIKLRVAIRA